MEMAELLARESAPFQTYLVIAHVKHEYGIRFIIVKKEK